ncbi:MAG: LPS export ABC transporter periplasmic protein LptC [Pseudomonadota bacterium]
MAQAPQTTGRLDALPTAPRLTGEEAAQHSATVRRLRIALPTIGAILVGVFIANTGRNHAEDVFLDELKSIEASTEELRMAKPHFSGVDADGTPFDITAESAIQTAGDDKRIGLEKPRAVSGGGGDQSVVSAEKGRFDSEANTLLLNDNVVFEHTVGADNYVLNTSSATFLIDEDRVLADTAVAGTGPRGATLRADRMEADNESRTVVFEGNVAVRIYPDRENVGCGTSPLTPGKLRDEGDCAAPSGEAAAAASPEDGPKDAPGRTTLRGGGEGLQ